MYFNTVTMSVDLSLSERVAYQKLRCFELHFAEVSMFGMRRTKMRRFKQSQQRPTTSSKGKKWDVCNIMVSSVLFSAFLGP